MYAPIYYQEILGELIRKNCESFKQPLTGYFKVHDEGKTPNVTNSKASQLKANEKELVKKLTSFLV